MNNPGSLTSRTVLATLHTRLWTGIRRDHTITEEICEEKKASRKAIRANKSLVGDEIKPLRRAERNLREVFRRNTLAWNDDATRILKASVFKEFRHKMTEPLSQFRAEIDKFIEIYPTVIENARSHLGQAWSLDDYPSNAQIKACFGVSLTFSPLPQADNNDFRASMSAEEVEIIRNSVEAQLRQTMENANTEILERLRAPLIRYAERLKIYHRDENGTENHFRDSLVDNIKAIVELAPKLNITDNPTINNLCEMIKRDIAVHDPDSLRHDQALRHESCLRAKEIVEEINALGF